jgi:hypothetical protein
MNVYFVNPIYVKPEAWKPLLTYLKVKAAYSFTPKDQLPESLYSIIRPYLVACYSNQDIKKFSDNCAFWLRAHFEENIQLISEDYENVGDLSNEERTKYSSPSAFNNLKYLDEPNCLVLLDLKTEYNEKGGITPPGFYVGELQDHNLPTHIARYCLNILHKRYGHSQYQNQSAFIAFDEFFVYAYRYLPQYREWRRYKLLTASGSTVNFMVSVNYGVKEWAPKKFPIVYKNGKKCFTLLRTKQGEKKLIKLIKEAEEAKEIYEEQKSYDYDDGKSWQEEAAEMNREFWRECGEAGSNCESWPGWG